MTVLITGANGFIGSAVCTRLKHAGYIVQPVVRSSSSTASYTHTPLPPVFVDFESDIDWSAALEGITEVIHLAARVHAIKNRSADQLEAYRQVNVAGTLNLARQAAEAGVSRFVFVSSIKVNGEETEYGQPYEADDLPAPLDPYGVSKLEAEQGLREIEAQTGLEVVIVRPPLVYGPGVKANFASMMRWVARGIPLPLGAIHNARSMVALENLVDLLVKCLKHPAAAGQTFLVSDGEDVSTTELLRRTALAMGKKTFLLPVPAFVLKWGAALLGKRAVAQRLCGSLQLDINKTRQLLGWTPPMSVDEGLRRAAEGYRQ
jgi:nucleoside-diphosphate-sugar epimerase